MGYNRYIYSDATLKAKASNNKVGLLKNKKRSDIVAYGTELVLSQIKYVNSRTRANGVLTGANARKILSFTD